MPSPGAHRRARRHIGRHRVVAPPKSGVPTPGLIVAGCLIGSTALFTSSGSAETPAQRISASDLTAVLDSRDEAQLSRSFDRTPATVPSPASSAIPSPTPSAKPKAEPPKQPTPVAGLNQSQMNNAATIARVGQRLGLPRRALIIGVATAMQESNLYNLASTAVPESFNYPNEGKGSDYDSVGIFQQRPSQGWGTVENLMKPEYQSERFFTKLMLIDWQNMSLAAAAQAVQVSAFPDAYAKHESRATTVVDAIIL
jgi:hypothetical protein